MKPGDMLNIQLRPTATSALPRILTGCMTGMSASTTTTSTTTPTHQASITVPPSIPTTLMTGMSGQGGPMLMLLGHLSMRFLLRTGSHCLSRKTTRGGYPSPPFLDRIGNPVPPKSCVINIEQLDGNMSLSFLDMSLVESESECITVHTGYRPPKTVSPRLPSTLKTVRRDNKVLQGVSLPKLSVYNMRSLIPKVESLGTDMLNRSCSLSFLTEVWTKSENTGCPTILFPLLFNQFLGLQSI